MKRKYIYSLAFIFILIMGLLTIGTGYGLYVAMHDKDSKSSTTLDCFKIYFSDTENVYMTNINPIVNEDGKETSPRTITVTNICKEEKELQLRLNILNTTTVDISSLMIFASGNIEKEITDYKSLKSAKSSDEAVVKSKLIGLIKMKPNETVRTNIKLWFNEKKAINIESDQVLSAKFELIDTDSSIKPTLAENLIGEGINEDSINLNDISTVNEGLHKTIDNIGETYYFRGMVDNNYLKFADNMWRIVRINGDNSIRIILDKGVLNTNYSNYSNMGDYTGINYVYNNELINNLVNEDLITWFNDNIENQGLDKYVVEEDFCNDTSNSINNFHTYYGAYKRLDESKEPTLVCSETNVDYGGLVKQKVGLITADEVALAGGGVGVNNYNYYLYNNEAFYTMSPAEYYNYRSYIYIVNEAGSLVSIPTNSPSNLRPVINLDSTITVTGSGTFDDPYIVDLD